MSQETLNLIIGALIGIVSSLLSQIASNYFQRKNDERKRKWELEDREFNRRTKFNDSRIAEAQEYINTYLEVSRILFTFETAMTISEDIEPYRAGFDKIIELTNFTANRMGSVYLGDSELADLNTELVSLCDTEIDNTFALIASIRKKETLDKEAIITRVKDFSARTGVLFGKMQNRLDKLAQTIP